GVLQEDRPQGRQDWRQAIPGDHDACGAHGQGEEGGGGKREGPGGEGEEAEEVTRVYSPTSCLQSQATHLSCRTCGEHPSVVHIPARYVGYFCGKCCPACRRKPARLH